MIDTSFAFVCCVLIEALTEAGALMVVSEVPVFLFPLAAGPATASLEFIAGNVAGLAMERALRVDPSWVDTADKTFDIITSCLKLLLLILFNLWCESEMNKR